VKGISYHDGYCYVAGLFAVLGHVFPVYYGFKGGKGVLVTATTALILTPIPFIILLAIFVLVVYLSRYVSLGSVIVAVLYPVVLNGYINLLGARSPGLISLCTVILAIFIVWCHRENLARISNRTERKISFKKKEADIAEETKDGSGEE
jgi:glycerol-3-phosphate acyltransferase PlsY